MFVLKKQPLYKKFGGKRGRLDPYCIHHIVNFVMWPSWVVIYVSFLLFFITCILSVIQKEHVSLL